MAMRAHTASCGIQRETLRAARTLVYRASHARLVLARR